MTQFLRQSTAGQVVYFPGIVSSTDGDTEQIGLTILSTDIKILKSGSLSMTHKEVDGATHTSLGVYGMTLSASDTDTLGLIELFTHPTSSLLARLEAMVMEANAYDALMDALGTGSIEADVTKWKGTAPVAPTTAGVPEVDVTFISGTAQTANDNGADINAILLDTANMQPKLGTPSADISADIAAVKAETALIVADTNELQIDWANGGRLDLIIDAILVDTGTTLLTHLTDIKGATWASTDSLEAIRNRGDSAWLTATSFSTHSAADVWAVATRLLTAGTNIALAKGVGLTGLNDIAATAIISDGTAFNATAGVLDVVNLANTTTTNTDMKGTDGANTVVPDAAGVAPTVTEITTDIDANSSQLIAIKAKTDALPDGIQKNTALANFPFFMVDSTDNVTGKTGLTVTAQRSIDGAAFGNASNAVTELANGVYNISLSASDLNGDAIIFKFTATGALARLITVLPQ